jgi:hypothetical protein
VKRLGADVTKNNPFEDTIIMVCAASPAYLGGWSGSVSPGSAGGL